jgi:hypothetical protein
MNAMEWLVRQLVWEQRLGQLRTGAALPKQPARDVEHADVRKAA